MASYYSGWVASDDWRLRLDVTVTNTNGNTTYATALNIENNYMYLSGGSTYLSWSITIDGATQSGTINRINNGQWLQLGTYSRTINKGTSSRTVGISFKASSPNNSIAAYRSGTSGSANQTLGALPSHTVSYNANGGTGAPGNQTKWWGSILTLSSVKPSRTGYNFRIWNTASNGSGRDYSPGGQYGEDTNVTLYAQWTAYTYTVSYNANGGSGAPGNQTKTYGVNLTLSSTRPTRTNYNFKGWATSSSATTAQYQPGGTYSANAAVTLYAVWELAYTAPRITALTATRCNSAGTLADDGTYAKVTFNWATDRTVSLVRINVNNVNTDVSSSGTSGSVSRVVGAGGLDTEQSYLVTITVTDSVGSSTFSTTISAMAYIIDFSPQGGIGIGTVAPNEKRMDVAIPANLLGGLSSPLPIASGGTAANTRANAINNLSYLGANVTGGTENDTRAFWQSLGTGYTFISALNQINGQPSQWGFIINIVYSGEVHQEWWTQSNGTHYHRGGNGSTGAMPGWTTMYDSENDINELNWTGSGLRGRVMKQIWSGNWSSGSITVAEAPYYNVFVVGFAQSGASESAERGILIRSASGNRLRGGAVAGSDAANTLWIAGFSITISGSTLTMNQNHQVRILGTAVGQFDVTIVRLSGLL